MAIHGTFTPDWTRQDAINVTTIALALGTVVMLLYWLAIQRPISRSRGAPKASIRTVRGSAILMALVAGCFAAVAGYIGYLWFFGLAAYAVLWMAILCWLQLRFISPRFRSPINTLAFGMLPLALGLASAWASYIEWVDFRLTAFWALCLLSALVFVYVAMRPVREGPVD